MAGETRRAHRGVQTGGPPDAGGTATGPIGEAQADEFAGDVAGASGRDDISHHLDGPIAGAAGGGTGIGDMAGGTGIGTSDAGDDAGEAGSTGGGGAGAAGR